MATLPADRTKLALAQSNQNPLNTLGSSQNKNALTEAYDTIDTLYNYATGLVSATTLSRLGVINVKDYNASGLATTATGSITTGTKVLTLTTTPDFVAGQGINLQGVFEVASLQVTAAATSSANCTVTLNGVAFTVALTSGATAVSCATAIRAGTFTGWTAGGTALSDTVTFTSNTTGTKTDATYSAGTTGATGTMTTTTQGTADQISTVSSISGSVVNIADNATRTIAAGTILHDDKVAIQAAINACSALGGGMVYLPVGNYKITDYLVPKDNVTIRGAGKFVTTITQSGNAHGFYLSDATGHTGMVFKDFTIEQDVNQVSTTIDAFQIVNFRENCKIEDVYISDWLRYGTNLDSCYYATFDRVYYSGIKGYGAYFPNDANGVKMNHCRFSSCGTSGVAASGAAYVTSSVDVTFDDCFFEVNRGGAGGEILKLTSNDGVKVINNYFENNLAFIDITASSNKAVIIQGNFFTGNSVVARAMSLTGNSGLAVIGNEVLLYTTFNIYGDSTNSKVMSHSNYTDDDTKVSIQPSTLNLVNNLTFSTAGRPTTLIKEGTQGFDTTLNKPIWRNASNNAWLEPSMYVGVPASAVATGVAGNWSADATWLYICHAANTWKRVGIATW